MSRQPDKYPNNSLLQRSKSSLRRFGRIAAVSTVAALSAAAPSLARANNPDAAKRPKPVTAGITKKPGVAERLNKQVHSEKVTMARALLGLAARAKNNAIPNTSSSVELLRSGRTEEEVVIREDTGTKIFNGDPGQYNFILFVGDSAVSGDPSSQKLGDLNPTKVHGVILYEEELGVLNFVDMGSSTVFNGSYPHSSHPRKTAHATTNVHSAQAEHGAARDFSLATRQALSIIHHAGAGQPLDGAAILNPPF